MSDYLQNAACAALGQVLGFVLFGVCLFLALNGGL